MPHTLSRPEYLEGIDHSGYSGFQGFKVFCASGSTRGIQGFTASGHPGLVGVLRASTQGFKVSLASRVYQGLLMVYGLGKRRSGGPPHSITAGHPFKIFIRCLV